MQQQQHQPQKMAAAYCRVRRAGPGEAPGQAQRAAGAGEECTEDGKEGAGGGAAAGEVATAAGKESEEGGSEAPWMAQRATGAGEEGAGGCATADEGSEG